MISEIVSSPQSWLLRSTLQHANVPSRSHHACSAISTLLQNPPAHPQPGSASLSPLRLSLTSFTLKVRSAAFVPWLQLFSPFPRPSKKSWGGSLCCCLPHSHPLELNPIFHPFCSDLPFFKSILKTHLFHTAFNVYCLFVIHLHFFLSLYSNHWLTYLLVYFQVLTVIFFCRVVTFWHLLCYVKCLWRLWIIKIHSNPIHRTLTFF